MGVVEAGGTSYHVDHKTLNLWEKNSLKKLEKYNSDKVYIVDGRERSGKSWWAIQQMGALEPNLFKNKDKFLSRVCFTPEDFHKAVRETKNGVIIFDEAFRGLSSRAALSKINKKLIQTLMEMGQNNNLVFIILPSFFLLDIYPAMLRSDGLFHIYQDNKTKLRAFIGYNRQDKNVIYQQGIKKGWKYIAHSSFRGRFSGKFPGGEEFEKAYLKKKRRSLEKIDQNLKEVEERAHKDTLLVNGFCWVSNKIWKVPIKKIKQDLTDAGLSISTGSISGRGRKHGETPKTIQNSGSFNI